MAPTRRAIAATTLGMLPLRHASAQGAGPGGYPARPIRLIVPFPPGGGVDLTARLLAEPLGRDLGQPVVVENRGGAGGVIGVEAMSRAAPDGYTLSLDGAGTVTAAQHLRTLPYDPTALKHITRLVRMPFIVAVRTDLPARSLAELLALARRAPLSYASGGVGTSGHLTGELFNQMAGVAMTHVPYRGSGPAANDLAARVVDVYFGDPSTLSLIQSGQARALAVTSPERWSLLPDVEAVAEQVPGYVSENWYGLAAPPGTPDAIIGFLNERVLRAMRDPETAARFDQAGLHPAVMELADYAAFLRSNSETWARVARAGNIRITD